MVGEMGTFREYGRTMFRRSIPSSAIAAALAATGIAAPAVAQPAEKGSALPPVNQASAAATTRPGGLAAYRPIAPLTLAWYDTDGHHGGTDEVQKRRLTGRLLAVGYESPGGPCVLLYYEPRNPEVMAGTPLTFGRVIGGGAVLIEARPERAFVSTFLTDVLFPRELRPGSEAVTEEYRSVTALETQVPVSVRTQTVPDRRGAGWVRTEKLVRPSEDVILPPGPSRVTAWESKYAVEADGTLSLADVRYEAEVPAQQLTITVHVHVARRESRALTDAERKRLDEDVSALRQIAMAWRMERGESRRLLDRFEPGASGSVFAPILGWMREHLVREIARYGEYIPPFEWSPTLTQPAPHDDSSEGRKR